MSEDEYHSLVEFQSLPLFDSGSPQCRTIDTAIGQFGFNGQVFKTDELEIARDYLTVPDLVPRGGIRHLYGTLTSIIVYFWRKTG
jgi:hypothetical protein